VSAPLLWSEIDDCEPGDFTLATMPARFAAVGDRHLGIDEHPCSLEALLELSERHQSEGLGDAPWPPQYRKQPGEPPRVQPSRRRKEASEKKPTATGRRVSKRPLIEIARSTDKDAALAGLERWKSRHGEAASRLQPADVLVDSMRGRSTTWTRIRVNLQHVPVELRPAQEALDPDDAPEEFERGPGGRLRWTAAQMRAWHEADKKP
jgi:hypothetical protein